MSALTTPNERTKAMLLVNARGLAAMLACAALCGATSALADPATYRYQAKAGDTLIAVVNEAFNCGLPKDEFDTIGGLVSHELGRVPRRGEAVELDGLRFMVMLARGGSVRWFKVTRLAVSESMPEA